MIRSMNSSPIKNKCIYVLNPVLFLVLILFFFAETGIAQTNTGKIDFVENREFIGLGAGVAQAQFSPFSNYFAYSLIDNTIRIFDNNWKKLYEHQGNPESYGGNFVFTPDEEYLILGKYKSSSDIAVIRLSDQKVLEVLNQHSSPVSSLAMSHDGRYLSSCGVYDGIIIWERKGEKFIKLADFQDIGRNIYESSFSYDDRFLVTGDLYGSLKIFEKKGNEYMLFQDSKRRGLNVYSIQFIPGKHEFVVGSISGLRRYKLDGTSFSQSDSSIRTVSVRQNMKFSPQGDYLAAPSSNSLEFFKVWEDSLQVISSLRRHSLKDHSHVTSYAAFSEDGNFLVSSGLDEKVIIWEAAGISSSDKATVSSWLKGDMSLAIRRSLTPGVCRDIIGGTNSDLSAPRDEFEKTVEYDERMRELSDQTLSGIQVILEKEFELKVRGSSVEIPLTKLVGYNADLEIYKVKFMNTEAGVRIPVEAARKLKQNWNKAYIKADKMKKEGSKSYSYENFVLVHPVSGKEYEVLPVENPFLLSYSSSKYEEIQRGVHTQDIKTDTVNGITYALLFATDIYQFYDDLANPVLDAQTIAAELNENYGVQTEVVVNPTLEETVERIREYAGKTYGGKDNLLVFFAGHGVFDDVFREGYVISSDSRADDLGKTSYLSHSNLRTMVNNIKCPHIFLVMDVCFGGTFDQRVASHRGSSVYSDISVDKFIERKQRYTTRLFLTSGGKEYVGDGRPGFHSPFGRRFIQSLREFGGDDGVLTTAEIYQYVERLTPQPIMGEFGDNEPGSDFILVFQDS